MGTLGSILAHTGTFTLGYAERLMNGIDEKSFGRLARPGGVEIKANHPAWVFGHLSIYPPRTLAVVGHANEITVPAGFEELFKNGAECRDDPTGSIYPPMHEIRKWYFDGYRLAIRRVAEADDALLSGVNPTEGRMRELFPMLGAMLNFYLSAHAQMHLGQVSTWRRMMGLPAA